MDNIAVVLFFVTLAALGVTATVALVLSLVGMHREHLRRQELIKAADRKGGRR